MSHFFSHLFAVGLGAGFMWLYLVHWRDRNG